MQFSEIYSSFCSFCSRYNLAPPLLALVGVCFALNTFQFARYRKILSRQQRAIAESCRPSTSTTTTTTNNNNNHDYKAQYTTLENERNQIQTELKNALSELDQLRTNLETSDQNGMEISRLRTQLAETTEALSLLQDERNKSVGVLQEQLASAQQMMDNLRQEAVSLEKHLRQVISCTETRLTQALSSVDAHRVIAEQTQQQLMTAKTDLTALQQEKHQRDVEVSALEARIDKLQQQADASNEQLDKQRQISTSEIQRLSAHREELQIHCETLEKELEELRADRARLVSHQEELRHTIQGMENRARIVTQQTLQECGQLNEKIIQLLVELKERDQQITDKNAQITQMEQQLVDAQAQIQGHNIQLHSVNQELNETRQALRDQQLQVQLQMSELVEMQQLYTQLEETRRQHKAAHDHVRSLRSKYIHLALLSAKLGDPAAANLNITDLMEQAEKEDIDEDAIHDWIRSRVAPRIRRSASVHVISPTKQHNDKLAVLSPSKKANILSTAPSTLKSKTAGNKELPAGTRSSRLFSFR